MIVHFKQGDTIKIKKDIPNYSVEYGFIYSDLETKKSNYNKLWISIGEGVFLFIEKEYLLKSKILLIEKVECI
jgi:hypothetical protein